MNITEQAFMRELKELLDRYDVTFKKDRVYYAGDTENQRLVFGKDESLTYLIIDDIADLRGGWGE